VKNANMIELRCLITALILAITHFRPSSPRAQNDFIGGENLFRAEPAEEAISRLTHP
jgi:hypothetical protein